jgi:hypothetical protein
MAKLLLLGAMVGEMPLFIRILESGHPYKPLLKFRLQKTALLGGLEVVLSFSASERRVFIVVIYVLMNQSSQRIVPRFAFRR